MEGQGNGFLTTGLLGANDGHYKVLVGKSLWLVLLNFIYCIDIKELKVSVVALPNELLFTSQAANCSLGVVNNCSLDQ